MTEAQVYEPSNNMFLDVTTNMWQRGEITDEQYLQVLQNCLNLVRKEARNRFMLGKTNEHDYARMLRVVKDGEEKLRQTRRAIE